ncbi:hypothetical protein D3C80_1790880 [compost metagenome]
MADLDLHLIQIVYILAAQIDHQLILIQIADLLDTVLADRGINFNKAAFLKLLDVHCDGAVAEVQLLGNFIQVKGLIAGEQLQNLNPDFRAQRFENFDSTH